MKVVVISGSPRKEANTQHMMRHVFEHTKKHSPDAKFINLSEGKIDYYSGDGKHNESTRQAAADITAADVWLIGTPIYNSFFSSALKNLFEYINYKETEGKVAGLSIMAAGDIGFVDVQTVLTQLMSYFGVTTNPRAVYMKADMISDGIVTDTDAKRRLEEMTDKTLDMASKLIPNR